VIVKEVMNTEVKTIGPKKSILTASKKMVENHIGCLVVSTNDKLVGILTDSDIIRKVVSENKLASKVSVEQVMTKDLIMVEDDKDVSEAAELMTKHGIKKLPVISGRKLVGIITAVDITRVHPELVKQVSKLLVFPKKGRTVAG
jgi:CBS domain-containing protein